jgi:hypothetical protein
MKRIIAKKRTSMGVFFLNTLGHLHCLALRKFTRIDLQTTQHAFIPEKNGSYNDHGFSKLHHFFEISTGKEQAYSWTVGSRTLAVQTPPLRPYDMGIVTEPNATEVILNSDGTVRGY